MIDVNYYDGRHRAITLPMSTHQLPAKPDVDMSTADDDKRGGREKFRRERDEGYGYPKKDAFGRDNFEGRKRQRSESPEMDRRRRRRSPSPRGSRGGGMGGGDGDHYIPNYDRDGYAPAPRYNGGYQSGGGGYDGGYNGGYAGGGGGGGGYRSNKVEDPLSLDYQMSFRQFCDFTRAKSRDRVDDDEIRRKFQTYKEQYQAKLMTAFFDEQKEFEWFREKYHPVESQPLKEQIYTRRRAAVAAFFEEFKEGKLDEITYDDLSGSSDTTADDTKLIDALDTNAEMEDAEPKKDDTAAASGSSQPVASTLIKETPIHALFIKSIPPNIKRQQVVDLCKDTEGYAGLVFADPRSDKKFHRLGWVVFNEGANLEKALEELNNKKVDEFTLSLSLNASQPCRSRLLPIGFSHPDRLERDLENARRLVKALDQEAGINNIEGGAADVIEARLNDLVFKKEAFQEPFREDDKMDEEDGNHAMTLDKPVTEASIKKIKLQLDLYIEYLRRIHSYDFYSGIEAEGPEDFFRRAWINLRKPVPAGTNPVLEPVPSKPHLKSDYQRFSERLDSRVALRTLILSPGSWGGEELEKIGGKNPEVEIDNVLAKDHVAKIEDEKFRCKDCSKLFRGEEFVKKHIRSKHADVVAEIRVDIDFYNGYARDPNRVHYQTNFGGAGGGNMGGGGMNMGSGGYQQFGGYGGVPVMAGPPVHFTMNGGGDFGYGGGGYYGGGGGRGGGRRDLSARLGPPVPSGGGGGGRLGRDGKPLPVDPRSRISYDDLDAPKGEDIELNYD
ncbi:hypothetical protein HDU97_005667 [Phlyctochytrium planicorne]|nr:hypothetical protein HDU97_005667 [Phlyctochytrium planicorne]